VPATRLSRPEDLTYDALADRECKTHLYATFSNSGFGVESRVRKKPTSEWPTTRSKAATFR